MTVSYSALFLALITIKRTQKVDDYPAQLIEDTVVMRHLGIPRILDETWVPPNLIPIQAARLHHFIDKVRNKPNGDKADFVHSGPDSVAERKAYKLFFPKISRKINSLVELAMKEHGAHPQDILRTSNTDDFPPPNNSLTWLSYKSSSRYSATLSTTGLAFFWIPACTASPSHGSTSDTYAFGSSGIAPAYRLTRR